ncbi:hypothetical protein MMC07_001996, partial [Pseudocyphellaria aurata]|nr:hypothetical protein [Pseudocyphellaria aurata]
MHIYQATLTLLLSHYVHAIEVTPNSNCSSLCDDSASSDPGKADSSTTNSNELVCDDDEFSSTVVGRKFKECLICELNSTVSGILPNENDINWLIFNMKYNVDWCVFGYPNNPQVTEANSRCGNVCSGSGNSARAALVDNLLIPDIGLQTWRYCQNGDGAFSKIANDCMKCLNEVPQAKTLTNFVNALNVACDQQPSPGQTLELYFDIFSAVATLNPSSTASLAGIVTVTRTPANPPTSSSVGIVTVAVTPANPLSSSSAILAAPSSSRAVASASAAPANNRVRVGVGVGVGIGGAALVLAIIIFRGRSTHNREVFEREAQARWEAEYLAAHGVPNSNHQPQQEQNVGVAELIAPDYVAGVAEFIAPDCWAGVAEFSAPDYLVEADGRRLVPELDVKIQR